MLTIFSRLRKIFQAEAHTAVSRLEDPVKLTDQGIRDLKRSLNEGIISLAQVKSVTIRMHKEVEAETRRAAEYERKAVELINCSRSGELAEAEADRLATEALRLKRDADVRQQTLAHRITQQEELATRLQNRIEGLRNDVSRFENELVTLRARAQTAQSVRTISQHLMSADSSSTVAMLERMREKVAEEEALAEAYEKLSASPQSVDEEVDRALARHSPSVQDHLTKLKAQVDADHKREA